MEIELLRLSLIFEVPIPLGLARALGKAGNPAVDDDGTRLVALGAWDVFPDVADDELPVIMANRMVAEWSMRAKLQPPSKPRQVAVARVLVPELRRAWASIRGRVFDEMCMRAGSWLYTLAKWAGDIGVAAEFARLAVAWQARISTPKQARSFARRTVEHLDGLAALDDAALLRDVAGLHQHGGYGEFWVGCLERALACSGTMSAFDRGSIHYDLATARMRQGRLDEAQDHLAQSLTRERERWHRRRGIYRRSRPASRRPTA